MKKLIVSLICVAGLLTAESDRAVAQETKKSLWWQATTQNPPAITHSDKPSQPMAFAAAELRRYLEQILAAKLPETHGSDNTPIIHLSIDSNAGLTDEGYKIYAQANTCHITAGGDLGLVFGAYEFLRRYGGCQFSDMGPDGEYIPRKQRIEADGGPLLMKPKLWYRGLQFYYYEDAELDRQRIDWMTKNGMNYLTYTPAPETTDPKQLILIDPQTGQHRVSKGVRKFTKQRFDQQFLPEVRKRGLKLDMNHHNLLYWLPTARYLADHPQWYAQIEGRRGKILKQLCICTSNEEAVNTLIDNIRIYLRENPDVKIVGVIPEDGHGMCQCQKCVAADENPNDAFRKSWHDSRNLRPVENPSTSRRYAKLLNAVARAIRDEFPDVFVGGAAYIDLSWPPRDMELEPNTTIWVALYWRDACRPIAATNTSELNKFFFDILRQWKDVYRGRLIVYEYYMGMNAQCSLPYPMSEVICRDWQHLKRLGVEGATIQSWSSNHRSYALNNLTFARCGWYDQVNHDQLLDDFLQGVYGSVGKDVRPIFQGLIQAMRNRAKIEENLSPNAGNIQFFLKNLGPDTIQQALKAAKNNTKNKRERRQIQQLTAAVRYWQMAADIFKLSDQANQLKQSDPAGALTLFNQILDEHWPRLRRHMENSMPPGWLAITTVNRWDRKIIGPIRKQK